MKLLAAIVFVFLAVSAYAEEESWEIDWSKVVPRTEVPGFWDGRDIKLIPKLRDQRRTGRIVGGVIVTPHTHPYQAGLLMSVNTAWTGLCGGSILSTRAILTAAHCPDNTLHTQVVLGAHQITAFEANQQRITVQASGYRLHAQYNRQNLNNDIAILILPSAATLNAFVAIARLPTGAQLTQTFDGQHATVSGWGIYSDALGATSSHLRSVSNHVISNALCFSSFGGIVIPSTLCVSSVGGRGACNSDSGGPLT